MALQAYSDFYSSTLSSKSDAELAMVSSARPPTTRRRRQEDAKAVPAVLREKYADTIESPFPEESSGSPNSLVPEPLSDHGDVTAAALHCLLQEKTGTDRLARLTDFFERFFTNTGTVATLGASISFALIVSQLQDPAQVSKKPYFSLSAVRILLATSWFLFTAVLGLSFLLNGLVRHLFLNQERAETLVWEEYAPVIVLVYGLMIGAFLCLSLVVVAYVDAVGFLAVALISVLGLMVISMAIFGRNQSWLIKLFQPKDVGLSLPYKFGWLARFARFARSPEQEQED